MQTASTKALALLLLLGAVLVAGGAPARGIEWDAETRQWSALQGTDGPQRCTTIVAGKDATAEGAPLTSHTADCADCDFRFAKVPARDWPEGSLRKITYFHTWYPRLVDDTRGETWTRDNLEPLPQRDQWGEEVIAEIPQVPHTYALLEGTYGVMNEHQVAIGESTCAAIFWANPVSMGGQARVEAGELTRIALERTKTARDAIKVMGELAMEYGYYSADQAGGDESEAESAEALTVIDKKEAWVFHVMPDDTGTSAIWVAQRVPDGHISAVANQFVIREIIPGHPDFMYSDNIWDIAKKHGLWDEWEGYLDFTRVYAPPRAHAAYATRRIWRIFDWFAPSYHYSPFTDPFGSDYNFSVKPDVLLKYTDVIHILRDHYENTPFDMTKGLAAGPYGDPHRFDPAARGNMTYNDVMQGAFERPISMFRTSYSFVATSRSWVPDLFGLLWYAQYEPASATYMPVYVAAETLPRPLIVGSLFQYRSDSTFWSFAVVGNYASRFYKYAMYEVRVAQNELENYLVDKVSRAEQQALNLLGYDGKNADPTKLADNTTVAEATQILTDVVHHSVHHVLDRWHELFTHVVTMYHDGYRAENLQGRQIDMQKLFYPEWWLQAVGYFNNQPDPNGIMYEPSPDTVSRDYMVSVVAGVGVACSVLFVIIGFAFGRFSYRLRGNYYQL